MCVYAPGVRACVCVCFLHYCGSAMSMKEERHRPIFDGLISPYYAVLICPQLYSRSSNAQPF